MTTKVKKISLIAIIILFCNIISFSQNSIVGNINYHNDVTKPLNNVNVYINDATGTVIDSTTTDNTGFYQFNNLQDGTYNLNGSINVAPGGIDLGDSFLIFLHLIGYQNLDPMQLLSSDVNDDGIIDWADYWTIVTGWYTNGYPYTTGDWVFENPSITFNNSKDIDIDSTDFGGSSMGDVNGSFCPGELAGNSVFLFYNNEYNMNANQQANIDFNLRENIYTNAIGLIIEYPEDLVEIKNIESKIKNIEYKIENSRLIISWINNCEKPLLLKKDESLFTLKIKTTENFIKNKIIKFTAEDKSHFIDSKGENNNNTIIDIPKIINKGSLSISENNNYNTSIIYPNPVIKTANIEYNVYKKALVKINIYDISGRLIKCLLNKYQDAGNYKEALNTEDLNSGIYFYNININNNFSINKKFTIIK